MPSCDYLMSFHQYLYTMSILGEQIHIISSMKDTLVRLPGMQRQSAVGKSRHFTHKKKCRTERGVPCQNIAPIYWRHSLSLMSLTIK